MTTFAYSPPTQLQSTDDHFWGRYSIPVGISVLRVGDSFVRVPTPTHDELRAAGDEGTDWFRGGYEYVISESIRDELDAAGLYPGATDDGFGLGPFGLTGFGE